MQLKPIYIQTLKVGILGWLAAIFVWAIFVSGDGLGTFGFTKALGFFAIITVVPILLGSLIVAKALTLLKLNYTSNAKAYTVGILSTILIIWIAVLIISLEMAIYNTVAKDSFALKLPEEASALLYVIGIATVMGSWAVVPLGVWQGRFLKRSATK